MKYPGSSELSEEMRGRILNTFHQTLDLAGKGSQQEALLGCDFILRLDPLFEPARTLQERLQAGEGAVAIDDLAASAPAEGSMPESPTSESPSPEAASTASEAPAEARPAEPDVADLGGESEPDLSQPATPESAPGADLAETLRRMLVERDFQAIQGLAEWHRERIATDPDLQQIVQTALERHEAKPFVQGFLESSRKALAADNPEEARRMLQKAAELDASHPDVWQLERELAPPEEPAAGGELAPDELELEPTSEPAASLDTESEERITELLGEGQQAFEQGEYQVAIDAWSRIFLIDIDHAEANRRIELARKLKAEVERKIEEAFHEGMTRLESGAIDEAREALKRVLEMQPSHLAAQEYLDKIESGELTPGRRAAPAPPPSEPEPAEELRAPAGAEQELLEVPETEAEEEELAAPVTATEELLPAEWAEAGRPKRTLPMIAAAVLVLILAGGWFLVSKWDRIFPNSAVEPPTSDAPQPDPIARATGLHEQGKTPTALAQLRRLPPKHPQYSEAQALIAQWETSKAPEVEAGPSPEEVGRQKALIEEAKRAAAASDNLTASELLDRAGGIVPLEDEAMELQAATRQQLKLLKSELSLFRQGDWEYALPNLWRLHEQHPANRDIRQLMVDSYYNLGLRDLQRGDPVSASDKLAEALDLSPADDAELGRLYAFAQTYKDRPSDLLYQIYVKYQPSR